MKTKKKLLKCTIIFILFLIVFLFSADKIFENRHILQAITCELPNNINSLLKKDYGRSEYYKEKDGFSFDIEKIVNEKYFINYSWMSGNKSSFYVVLLIENKEKNHISNRELNNIYITDNLGNKYKAITHYFENYPKDTPLYYKMKIIVKFKHLDNEVNGISLHFTYLNNEYNFSNIDVN